MIPTIFLFLALSLRSTLNQFEILAIMNHLLLRNKLTAAVVVLLSFMVTSCMKMEGEDDQEKIVENETAIVNYLAANNLSGKKDTTGLYYLVTTPNVAGKIPAVGDEVQIIFKKTLLNGQFIDSTSSTVPVKLPFGVNFSNVLPGLVRSISLLKEGEKGSFFLPFYLAYGRNAYNNIPGYSPVRLDLELVAVRTELKQIQDYIIDNDLTVTSTLNKGLHIVKTHEVAEGSPIGTGKTAKVKYKLWALSDKSKVIDSGEYSFVTGSSSTIGGFDQGVQQLKVGEKAILLFPSELGYGSQGSYDILPYAPLAFEVEILP